MKNLMASWGAPSLTYAHGAILLSYSVRRCVATSRAVEAQASARQEITCPVQAGAAPWAILLSLPVGLFSYGVLTWQGPTYNTRVSTMYARVGFVVAVRMCVCCFVKLTLLATVRATNWRV